MNQRKSLPGAAKGCSRWRSVLPLVLLTGFLCGMPACAPTGIDAQQGPSTRLPEMEMNAELMRLRELVVHKARHSRHIQRRLSPQVWREFSSALRADGTFSDLDPSEHIAAFQRFHLLSAAFATMPEASEEPDLKQRIYRGLLEYSHREYAEATTFPQGAFEIPRSFLGSWFSLHEEIERDLRDPNLQPLLEELHEVGGKVAARAWIYPDHSPDFFRASSPLSIEVFRGQGHFIVANFVPYRPLVEYAVFLQDERYLDVIEEVAKRSLHEPVHPADPSKGFWTEGIHPDRNVTAHGPQTYIFGYGKDYLNGLLHVAELFDGSTRAFSQEEFDVIAEVMLDALAWFIYRDQMDYTVLGRHNLYPESGRDGNRLASDLIERLLAVAGDRLTRKQDLLQARARLTADEEFSGSRYFWNTEEYVHRMEHFCVVVNISSTRTTGPEIVKPWAEHNFHFANGAMMLYLDGHEYREARGAWHFRALPGITSEFSTEPPPYIPTWNGMRGTRPFAGGVSDGKSGMCGFVSAIEGEAARAEKAWFFHGETIVCLGAGISTEGAEGPVRTTLNQTAWRSAVHLVDKDGLREISRDEAGGLGFTVQAPAGLWHDNVGYLIEDGAGGFSAAVRPTDWVDLAEVNRDRPGVEEAPVFHLFLDHGHPTDAAYAYIVRPGTTPAEMEASFRAPSWRILKNTSRLQAVEFPGDGLVQAVFRQAGSVEATGLTLVADRPLMVMLRRQETGKFSITYQDPLHQTEQTEAELILTLDGTAGPARHRLVLALPQGIDLGRPVQRDFSR